MKNAPSQQDKASSCLVKKAVQFKIKGRSGSQFETRLYTPEWYCERVQITRNVYRELQLCETPPEADGIPSGNLEYVWFSDISYLILRKTLLLLVSCTCELIFSEMMR